RSTQQSILRQRLSLNLERPMPQSPEARLLAVEQMSHPGRDDVEQVVVLGERERGHLVEPPLLSGVDVQSIAALQAERGVRENGLLELTGSHFGNVAEAVSGFGHVLLRRGRETHEPAAPARDWPCWRCGLVRFFVAE